MPKRRQNTRSSTPEDKIIGLRIKDRRRDLGLSQAALSTSVGVTFQQVQKYETGASRIAATRLSDISRALQTTPNDLLGWNGGQPPVGRRKSR
jgi:transcriptional regulator with XRE-family HTH domain